MPVSKMRLGRMVRSSLLKAACRKGVKAYFDSHPVRKLQLGGGGNILNGWLNTDLCQGKDTFFLDVKEPFPFDDRSFDYIYCEHLVEHLSYREGSRMLRECYRVMKPGGRLRVSTPDLQFLIRLYNPEKTDLQDRYITWITDNFLSDIDVYQDTFVINNFFRDWGHRIIYDFKALQGMMARAGFVDIVRCEIGESADENLRLLERHGDVITDEFNRLETFVAEGRRTTC